MSKSWILLLCAGLLEISWAIGLKYTEGLTRLWPTVFTSLALVGSMILLAKAAHLLPIGTAYGVWVGIGAFGTAVLGMILFAEPVNLPRILFLALLLISMIGLKMTAATP